jgi:hypothetical protein
MRITSQRAPHDEIIPASAARHSYIHMSSETVDNPRDLPLKIQTKITSVVGVPSPDAPQPTLWQRGLAFVVQQPWLSVALSGLAIATLSLATWVGALFLENKILKSQLAQHAAPPATAQEADELKLRVADAQEQMSQLQTQLEQQQTAEMLDSREALINENARLLQELNQLSKPQLGAPLVNLAPASLKQAEANPAGKAEPYTMVDVPQHLALFTVVLHQAQDKGYQNYFVELTDGKGKNVAWSEQLKSASAPDIPLTFAKRSHAPGKYRLKLYGMNGKRREFIDHYDLQLNFLPEPPVKKAGRKK